MCAAAPSVLDTPEVIAERNRFFQLYNAAAQAAAAAADPVPAHAPQQAQLTPGATKWTGPLATTVPAGVNGALNQVGDTADVVAARNAFLAAYNAQLAATAPQAAAVPVAQVQPIVAAPQPAVIATGWTGPFAATIPAGLPGAGNNVEETAEVKAAKTQFLQALQAAGGVIAAHGVAPAVQAAPAPAPVQLGGVWTGPVAATIPAGLPGAGPVQDTAEVAAAKAAFLTAHQQAGVHRHF